MAKTDEHVIWRLAHQAEPFVSARANDPDLVVRRAALQWLETYRRVAKTRCESDGAKT